MEADASGSGKNLLQIVAVFCAILFWVILVHKAHAVVSSLAQKHSGLEFWLALGRYFLGNLAGG